MRCRRTEEIDVENFLVDSASEAFEAFREHYPECEDCAQTVAGWAALDWAIREEVVEALPENLWERFAAHSGGVAGHPTPASLESFVISPGELGAIAMQIETHLSGCTTCRSEVNLLRQFDPNQFLTTTAPAAADRLAPNSAETSEGLAGLLGRLGGFLFAPGIGRLAMPALLLTLAVVISFVYVDRLGNAPAPQATIQIAEESSSESAPLLQDEEGPPGSGRIQNAPLPGESLDEAQKTPPMLAEVGIQAPDVTLAPEDLSPEPRATQEPKRYAQTATPSAPESGGARQPKLSPEPDVTPGAVQRAEPSSATPPDEILLAALTELPMPTYLRPAGGPDVSWMGQFGPVRSSQKGPRIQSLAPGDHTGLTLKASPHLWWTLSEPTDQPLQITVVDDMAINPLLRVDLPGPHAAGVHEIDLSTHNLALPPGRDYRWFVSILLDPNRPSRNPIAAGALRVLPKEDARRSELGTVSGSAKGHRLAELGIWYDAYDFFARLVREHPDQPGLQAYRDGLAQQVHPKK